MASLTILLPLPTSPSLPHHHHHTTTKTSISSLPTNLNLTHIQYQSHVSDNGGVKVKARFGSLKGGSNVLERPSFDQSQFESSPQLQQGGDIGRLKNKKGPGNADMYRVLLLDDQRHTENRVVKVLPQAVPPVTPDEARKIFSESRQKGVAVVIVTVKEHAEFYSQMMLRGGLRSVIEPDSGTL